MTYKLRPTIKLIKTETSIKPWHCIEILQGRKWTLLGDDGGLCKYATASERDSKLAELNRELAAA